MLDTPSSLTGKLTKRKYLFGISPYGMAMAVYFLLLFFDFVQIVPGVSPARLGGIALLVFFFYNWKSLKIRIDVTTGLIFAQMLLSFICLLCMSNPATGLNACFSLCLNCIICILGRSLPYSMEDYRICRASLVVGGLFMAAMVFVSPGAVGREWATDRIVVNVGGSQQDPNEFCGYLIVAAAFFSGASFRRSHYLLLVPACLIIYAALLTGSRGGLLALVAAVICAAVRGLSRSKHRMLALMIGAVVLITLLFNYDLVLRALPPSVAERFFSVSLSNGTASYRINAWINVLQAFAQSHLTQVLFGHGFGMTTLVTFNGLVAHNAFVEMIYTCGILGCCCYVGIWLLCINDCLKSSGYVELASLVGFAVLLSTLSDFSMKVCWGLFLLTFIRMMTVRTPSKFLPTGLSSNGD